MNKKIDTLIQKSLEKEFDKIKYPEIEKAWESLNLEIHHTRKSYMNLKQAFIACAIFVFICFTCLVIYQIEEYNAHNILNNEIITSKETQATASTQPEGVNMVTLASLIRYDLNNLIPESNLILRGVIKEVSEPKWNNTKNEKPEKITDSDIIYRNNVLKVSEVYKGDILQDDYINIRTFEYDLGNVKIMNNRSEPDFKRGDEVIVFLVNDKTAYNKYKQSDYYIVLGHIQGVFKVNNKKVENVHQNSTLDKFLQTIKTLIVK